MGQGSEKVMDVVTFLIGPHNSKLEESLYMVSISFGGGVLN